MNSARDFYEYAQLATAAYIRMGNASYEGGAEIVSRAVDQNRLPTSLATQLFDDTNTFGNPVWSIDHYFGSDRTIDPIAAADTSGFGATLFSRGTEKVLAIRGVQFEDDFFRDLVGASLGQIGILGMALTQTVSMVNDVLRQIRTKVSASFSANYLQKGGLPCAGVDSRLSRS